MYINIDVLCHLQITLLLCVATAFAYGNVEVKPTETTERNFLENSVHNDNNQFNGGYVATDIPTSEAPTTGPVTTRYFSQSVDVNGDNKVQHMETTPMPLTFNLQQTQPQQFPAHSHRYNGFSTAHPFPMHQQMPFQSYGPHPFQPFWANRFPYQQMPFQSFGAQPFWANRFPYQRMAFQPFGPQTLQPFWANRIPNQAMAYQSFGPQSTWFNRFNGFDMHRPMPYMMPPFQRFGLPQAQFNPMHPLVIVKLLQPIILPVVKNEEKNNSPKEKIEMTTERIITNGSGQKNKNSGQGFTRFIQGGDGFGKEFIKFEQVNNLGQRMNRAGQSFNRFGQQNNNFGQGTNRFEKLRSSESVPLRQNSFGPYRMNEDHNLHITVQLD